MVSHPLQDRFNEDKMIDISPHAPYGSKQARNAAKERAAQRYVSVYFRDIFCRNEVLQLL